MLNGWELNTGEKKASKFLFIIRRRMGINEQGSSWWIAVAVTDFEKNDGKKEQGALILQLPSKCCVYFLRAAGLRELSSVKRTERQKKGRCER